MRGRNDMSKFNIQDLTLMKIQDLTLMMKNKKVKVIVIVVLLIAAYPVYRWYWSKASWDYFQSRCEQDAGEFIYRTVENVEGLFQMRSRDPRDYFTRLREGDLPEDPYGHTNAEAKMPAALFLSYPLSGIPKKTPYQYLESVKPPNTGKFYDRRFPSLVYASEPVYTGDKYWLYELVGRTENGREIFNAYQKSSLSSRHAYTWRKIKNDKDSKHGVLGSELYVKDLKTDEVLGLKRGFFYKNKYTGEMTICPKGKSERMVLNFVNKVLIPAEITNKGEE